MESSLPDRPVRLRRRAGGGAILLLLIVLVFQLTVLPDTLGIKPMGRVANAFALVWFLFAGVFALVSGRSRKASVWYLLPVWLVIVGMSINIARNLSPESLGAAGALLAWLAAASMPFLRSFNLERSWKLFYRFMLWGSAVSVLEYFAMHWGMLQTTVIDTDRGLFLKGIISIFDGLDDGTVYYRLYGLFAEPGTYAMFLLPAIAYAWLRGRRWSAAFFVGCLYMTDSLGGIAGLIALGVTYMFWRSKKRPLGVLVALVLSAGVAFYASGSLRERYNEKGASATIRADNVTRFRDNFVTIVTSNPFGLPLNGKSLTELQDVSANYLGSNFEIYTIFVKGGIIACAGYVMLLVWMIFRNGRYLLSGDRDPSRAAAMICLPAMLLFVFQRDTVLSSALFAFLFAEPLLAADRADIPADSTSTTKRRRRRPASDEIATITEGSPSTYAAINPSPRPA